MLADVIRSQYRAALTMLRECIVKCPEEKWNDSTDGNRFWHLSYHTLFYTALYLSSEEHMILWPGCRPNHQFLGKTGWAPEYDPAQATVYTREELLDFVEWLFKRIDESCDDASTETPSQFSWIPMSRMECYFYNLRHLQHHCGQLHERINVYGGGRIGWAGMSPMLKS